MSVGDRIRRWLAGERAAPAPEPLAEAAPTPTHAPVPAPEPVVDAREQKLARMAAGVTPVDEVAALALVESLVEDGREARALVLGRELLARSRSVPHLATRLAELALSRGDETLAATLLAPVVDARDAPLASLVLAGELAERGDDPVRALSLYERALARDVDVPRAKERAARLRDARGPRPESSSATLLVAGALTRGRWRVLRELGRGGAGTVFLAHDVRTDRDVALKVYHARGPLERDRLRLEARVAASIEHPGVVRVVELDETLGAIAMEHLSGGSLRDLLRRAPLSLAEALARLAGVADALAFVHRHGIAHRDLKPSNVLLRADGRVVLSDFGLARPLGETGPSAFEGTLAFMPPEQRTGAASTTAMDVHALGATMREVLARVAGDVPPPLLALCDACTAVDAAARPSLDEVRRSLP